MFFYLTTIIVCMAIICAFNIGFTTLDPWYIILAVVINTVAVIVVDGIFATIVRWLLPKKWFSEDKLWFSESKKECSFYEKIGIKWWKDKVPELGMFTTTRKNKIAEPNNNEYVKGYIMEANYGVVVHIADVVFGFLIAFIYPLEFFVNFALGVALVNAVLNFLPIFILRYNLRKLHRLYSLNERKNKKLKS